MASSPSSLSVSVECVSACNLNLWRGGGGDCSTISCAWKAPRALTGSLASTTQCSSLLSSRRGIRPYNYRFEAGGGFWTESSCWKDSGLFVKLSLQKSSSERRKWKCSSFGSSSFGDISAECLFEDLKPTISYLPVDELNLVWRALKLAFDAHSGQKRRSGEPFIIHPVEVARILGELELDWESIAAGLLHDTVEDTNIVTFERIENDFGSTVRRIVEGETKVSKLGKLKYKNKSSCDVKADDLRQMFLAMTEEVRVIIVKLADRLHNMRTLTHMPSHKQVSIALETLQVFAPLAKLLGMYQIKSELENLSFMYTNPQDYEKITKRVAELYEDHERELSEVPQDSHLLGVNIKLWTATRPTPVCDCGVTKDLEVTAIAFRCSIGRIYNTVAEIRPQGPVPRSDTYRLQANKILVKKIENDQFLELVTVRTEVHAVLKEPYSIYKAVTKAKVSINEVNQIAQLRIIVKPKTCNGMGPLCSSEQIGYHVLGLVHSIWTPIPRSVKDYIASPKPNGYQSLHTTVIPFLYESMFRLEVQIRTEQMDLIAQRGIAAHYCGRVIVDGMAAHLMPRNSVGKSACFKNSNVALRIGWLHAIREWQEEFVGNMSSREFVDVITRDLLGSRVFVFTPRGETKNLPKGATVVDYAYMIHTEIGNKMVAAKVNGNLVSPTHVLDNAEIVEIITYDALSCKSSFQKHKLWLQHAKTRSARHKIMRYLREQASLSSEETTSDSVRDSVAHCEKKDMVWDSLDLSGMSEIFETLLSKSPEVFHPQNGAIQAPKVNGKHNKHTEKSNLEEWGQILSRENDISKTIFANTARPREVLPGLESWQSSKIAAWHCLEGNSIEWLSVVCIDRRGIMGEVVTVLASLGFSVCSCVVEIDRGRGMGVMLFHVEGSTDNMVDACARIDLVFGVLGWSLGCSWLNSAEPQ